MSSARRCGTPSWVADPSDAGPTPAHLRVVGVTSETVLVASADLRVVVVGMPASGPLRRRVAGLVPTLTHSGHHVVEQPWRDLLRGAQPAEAADLILLVEGGPATVAGQLTATRWARRPLGAQPPVVLLAATPVPTSPRADAPLRRRLFTAVDVVLAPTAESGARARSLGAGDVRVVPLPSERKPRGEVLAADGVRFVATLETIAARGAAAGPTVEQRDVDRPRTARRPGPLRERAGALRAAVRSTAHAALDARRGELRIGFRDLPEWVRPTDVLLAHSEAAEVIRLARRLGLPLTARPVAAWAALGALSAVLRVRDGNRRTSVIVDPAAPGSVFSRWARAIGYAPVPLDPALPVDAGTLDVITRLHPAGCTSHDVESTLARAASLLRRGGLLCLTLPVGGPETPAAVLPADLRGVVAGADALGLTLVGDLDRDLVPRLTSLHSRIETGHPGARTALALVRLTFRRTS